MQDDPIPSFPPPVEPVYRRRRRPGRGCCCLMWLMLLAAGAAALGLAALWQLSSLGDPINLLVLGVDRRPGEGNIVRADAIMLVGADAQEPSLVLLSIPRDLYLLIPNQGKNRINTAHVFGEMDRPGGGPERTAAAIEANFRLRVDSWVRLDFDGFVALIDAIGGLDINVPEAVVDYAYPTEDYGTMTIEIPAGLQRMDGERALQYARSRHTSSDFDRSRRQQIVVQALMRKLASPTTWPRIPALYGAFASAVDTDLNWLQLAHLGLTALRVGPEGIEQMVIDENMVTPYTTDAGAAVLAPRWEVIGPAVADLFD